MQVTLNGEDKSVPDGITVAGLLEDLGVQDKLVLIEKNGTAISRNRYPDEPVKDGDQIELVHLMGGG